MQIVVTVEVDFNESARGVKGLKERLESRIEQAADEMVEELGEDDLMLMPLYMNVKSEVR